MSWFSWNPTKIFAIVGTRREPIDMPSVCLYTSLLKMNSTSEQANVNSTSNIFKLKCIGASPLLNIFLKQSCTLSVICKLNKHLMSNEHILILSWLIFNSLISLANENETVVLCFEYTNSSDFKTCTHHLASLC